MVKRKIVWDSQAKDQLKEYCDLIRLDSPTAAKKVRKAIMETINLLKDTPNMFATDRFIDSKLGNYRAFTKWSYRITYLVTDKDVFIVKVMHTKQDSSTDEQDE